MVVKIDFQNAFNCIDRSVFFRGVAEFMPGLCRWVEWCHGASAHLVFGKHLLSSQSGLQQGDPLRPLLFSLALRPVATELVGLGRDGNAGRKLDLCFFYLDDGFLAGDLEIVSQALAQLRRACPALGLTLELSKSELVVLTSIERQDLHQHFPQELLIDSATGASRVEKVDFEFLGSPIVSGAHCAKHTNGRIDDAQALLDALATLSGPQVGLRLLRRCAGFCKLV